MDVDVTDTDTTQQQPTTSPVNGKKGKKSKPARTASKVSKGSSSTGGIDWSTCRYRHVAIKLMYHGEGYCGLSAQLGPGAPPDESVERYLFEALVSILGGVCETITPAVHVSM